MNESIKKEPKEPFKVRFKKYIKNLFDFSQYDAKTLLYIIIFIALVIISLVLILYMVFVDETFLYRIVIEWFVNPIYSLGILGIFLFIGIMGIQGLLVPIPSEIVLMATGMIWSWLGGGFMAIIGSMAAGILCFYISRKGGRPLAEKFIGENAIDLADDLIQKYGIKAIIITRFIPVIPFDVISYTSGLVDIDFKQYAIGTFLGSIFRSFFYSVMGALLMDSHFLTLPLDFATVPFNFIETQSNVFNFMLLVILAVLGVMFLVYFVLSKQMAKKKGLNKGK